MLDGIDTLVNYFNKYKTTEENNVNLNKGNIKRINKILECIKDRRYLTDLNEIEKIVSIYENVDIDNILNDVMLNVNRYNVYLMNKKVKFTIPVLDNDIPENVVEINLKNVLDYLEVDESNIDANLLYDVKKYIDFEKFENFSKVIKTSNDFERILFDKILDKNVLLSILLHSNIELVNDIIGIFKKYNANLNRVINNIPYIFIKEKTNSNCKYDVIPKYDWFINNVKLLEQYDISFKNMLYHPVYFVNDPVKNEEYILKLIELDIKPANVLEHVGNVLVLKPDVVFKNIDVLLFHGIRFTDDTNNNGYTILGMDNLDDRLDYYIEKEMWKNG